MIQGQTGIRLPPRWIELNFTKRECAAFIGTPEDETVCYCGRRKLEHDEDILAHPQKGRRTEDWTPSKHTVQLPTDAYGQIIFEGEHHPNKSRFVRLSYDTNPDMVLQLMTLVWGIEMPKLVITVRGGNKDFELTPRLGKILQVGLLKAAKHTGAWIFTSGLNQGVTKHVGNALGNERWLGFKRGRCVGIGIAPWGVVENRVDLLGRNRDRTYNQLQRADSKFCLLNPRLSNLILVDNGTVGKTGGDAAFRRRLERYMASYPMTPHRGCDTPVVCIVIEGGLYTLKVIAEYLHDDPPIPVVVLGHSGRTSDLLSYVMRKCETAKDLDAVKDELHAILMSLYRITRAQCPVILNELRKIVSKKNLVTIYTPHQAEDEGFDTVILASIFRSQHWTPLQQLSLTLAWNRVDIATNEVFVYGRDWSREHLEHAMMEALVSDRLDFVNLLLEHGLNMQLFLTPVRLEGLYSLEKTQTNHMRSLLLELAKIRSTQQKFSGGLPNNKNLSLHEVGLAMSHMMGHIYQSKYIHLRVPYSDETSDKEAAMDDIGIHTFTQPFDDLFIWAVLTKRHSMALLLWSHGPGALAKALVAVKLNRYFTEEMEQAETSNFAAEFQGYCDEWENLSLELLDSCFRQDPQLARQLLTMELDHWSKQTCLTLAVMGGHRMLLGHPCCQMLLVDLWMGALNIRHNVTTKIILGILCPFAVFCWDYKSTEELQLLPHQGRHELGLLNTTMTNADHNRFESESVRSNHSRSLTSVFPRSHPSTHDEVDKQKGDTVLNLSEVNVKLKEFKRNPIDNHPRQTHFHEKNHTILDSGAAGSFIFDNNSVLHKDGKDHRHNYAANAKNPVPDRGNARVMLPLSGFVTTKHELSMWNKFCEFQKAPITNFYRHTFAYLVFVCILAYVILVPQDKHNPGWLEIYVIAYVGSHGIDCIREMFAIDAYNWSQKWAEIRDEHIFVVADLFVSGFFMVGVGLRFASGKFFQYGVLLYRVSSIYWNLRLYKYMGVHRFVGPKIVMMSRMLKHMAYFAMIILVVLIAFGIARESIRFPNAHPTWQNIVEAFLEPYVMMFGEVDSDAVTPHCGGGDDQQECPVGFWIIPLTWVVYMMVANILIVNVLIAVFNGIYSEVDAISLELWMFQRFNFVMEFEQKPLLPPPLIIIYHVYAIFKYFVQKCIVCVCESEMPIKGNDFEEGRVIMGNDHSLKTFLNPAEINIVFDFEEDNVDLLNSTNEHLIKLSERQKTSMIEPPTSGFVDKASLVRDGPLAHVKTHLRDITRELEAQRAKIDKILEMYEIANEEEGDDDEYDTEPQPASNAKPPLSAAVSVQVPGQFMQTSPGVQANQGILGGEAGIVILGQHSAQHNPLHHSPIPVPQSQTHSGQRPPQNQNQQRPPQARK